MSNLEAQPRLLPVPNRLKPFWLSEEDEILANARTTEDIPKEVDVVIVGSGFSGAMTVYHILKGQDAASPPVNTRILMLEAAETCSGATARNGDHCKPMTYYGFEDMKRQLGTEAANAAIEFEVAHLQHYIDLVKAEDIDCDLHVTRACDVYLETTEAEAQKRSFRIRQADHPESVNVKGDMREIDDPEELEKVSGVKGGKWGLTFPAGHLWPYKLATHLISLSISKGMNIQTHTPALSIHPSQTEGSWIVQTPRGAVTTKSVVIATNAYTSGLLPEFSSRIIPVRGTACSITPAPSHSLGSLPCPLKYTYGLRFGRGEADYMIVRQGRGRVPGVGDRSIILGGAKGPFLKNLDAWYNNIRDDEYLPGVRKYFADYMKDYFVDWSSDTGNVDTVWSGVLGYSADLLPYVGEHPEKAGIFVLAGYTGHGMPRIPRCAEAVATLVKSRHETGNVTPDARQTFHHLIPTSYVLTKERLESRENLILGVMGQDPEKETAKRVTL